MEGARDSQLVGRMQLVIERGEGQRSQTAIDRCQQGCSEVATAAHVARVIESTRICSVRHGEIWTQATFSEQQLQQQQQQLLLHAPPRQLALTQLYAHSLQSHKSTDKQKSSRFLAFINARNNYKYSIRPTYVSNNFNQQKCVPKLSVQPARRRASQRMNSTPNLLITT